MRGGLQRESVLLDGFLIVLAGLLVVAGAWSADFIGYDDPPHISENAQLAPQASILDYFVPQPDEAFFPVTLLSWRLDRVLFSSWMPGALGSWAPGVRSMTWLYHVLAALVLWRVLQKLGLEKRGSLFVAAAFALHPTACETVCWATERKNALAGLFGFATLWLWLCFEAEGQRAPEGLSPVRTGGASGHPAARHLAPLGAYALALMSKSSALGILPVLVVLELCGGGRGLRGETSATWRADLKRRWPDAALRLLPFAALSAAFVFWGVRGHSSWMAEPPGGSAFTALLTDAWILVRYLANLLAPVSLSAAYAVEPIKRLGDGRLWLSVGLLAVTVAFSLWAAPSRRRALFGWLWFAGALGPSLNLVALPAVMTDRYLYLALPGFFLVVVEAVAGLWREGRSEEARAYRPLFVTVCASAYLAFLGTLSLQRSMVWRDMLGLFADAVKKEPRSAYAHYGLGMSYGKVWDSFHRSGDPLLEGRGERYRDLWMREWAEMLRMEDADRQLNRPDVALELASYRMERGADGVARSYVEQALETRGGVVPKPAVRTQALVLLGRLELRAGRAAQALEYFDQAVEGQEPAAELRLLRAQAHVQLAAQALNDPAEARRQGALAREELARIPSNSPSHAQAEELLKRLTGAP